MLAVVTRVAYIVVRPPVAAQILEPLADATDYDLLARSLISSGSFLNQRGHLTAFRPPIYPAFLALCYMVLGVGNLKAVACVQAVLAGVNAMLGGWIAGKLGGKRAAILAALGFAFYPAFIAQVTMLLSEELARTQLLLFAGTLLLAFERDWLPWWTASGFLLGLAILNKTVLLAATPLLALVILLAGPMTPWKRRWIRVALFTMATAGPVLFWTARNVAAAGRLILVSTNFPITYAHGVTKFSFHTNEWYGDEVKLLEVPDSFQKLTQLRGYRTIEDELDIGRKWRMRADEFIASHRAWYVKLTARKALHFWSPFIRNSTAQQAIALASMGPMILLGWLGAGRLLRTAGVHRATALAWIAMALAVTLPYAMTQADIRYRLALIDPLWIMTSAIFVASFLQRRSTLEDSP